MTQPLVEPFRRSYDSLAATYALIPHGGLDITMTTDLGPVEGEWDVAEQLRGIKASLHLPHLEMRMAFRMPHPGIDQILGVIVTKTLNPRPLEDRSAREVDVCIGRFLRGPGVLDFIDQQQEKWGTSSGYTACTIPCGSLAARSPYTPTRPEQTVGFLDWMSS